MSFTHINEYIIVIQMISHDSIKYSYCITHIFNKFTNFFSARETTTCVNPSWGCRSNLTDEPMNTPSYFEYR